MSITTNGRSGIKPEIAEHVRAVAKELGYKPNLAAKLLSDKKYTNRKIGIILVTENNAFYEDVLNGAKKALAEYADFGIGNIIHIQPDYDGVQQQIAAMEQMAEDGVGGIVLTPIHCLM